MSTREKISGFAQELEKGCINSALCVLSTLCQLRLKVSDLQKIEGLIAKHEQLLQNHSGIETTRLAVLGGYTTQPIELALRVFLLNQRVLATLYVSEYNTFQMEVRDPNSSLYQFKPNTVLFATGCKNIQNFPDPFESKEQVHQRAESLVQEFSDLWRQVLKRSGAIVIAHDFELPSDGGLGRLERKLCWARKSYVQLVNSLLWQASNRESYILGICDLASRVGTDSWFEPRWFYHSKHGFSPNLISDYARMFVGLYRAIYGGTKKCLALDLDNTLWGGVIGDDGLEGIELGEMTPLAEAYRDFCHYLKRLKERGIILAVNSKNETKNAEEVFNRHPDMPLELRDFSVFCCNWKDKGSNLRYIAEELNIDLSSIVMIDDSPVECEQIRLSVPEVSVVDIGDDPANFISRIELGYFFEQIEITQEDSSRAASYYTTRKVKEISNSGSNLSDFLIGLQMQASVNEALDSNLPRLEQLILKTNQFNLSTIRYHQNDLNIFISDKDKFCLSCKLQDKFTNYGIVSCVVGQSKDNTLVIDNWVMSCRVFSRTFEAFILNHLVSLARSNCCEQILASHTPSAKNGLIPGILKNLGFITEPLELESSKTTDIDIWKYPIKDFSPLQTYIKNS